MPRNPGTRSNGRPSPTTAARRATRFMASWPQRDGVAAWLRPCTAGKSALDLATGTVSTGSGWVMASPQGHETGHHHDRRPGDDHPHDGKAPPRGRRLVVSGWGLGHAILLMQPARAGAVRCQRGTMKVDSSTTCRPSAAAASPSWPTSKLIGWLPAPAGAATSGGKRTDRLSCPPRAWSATDSARSRPARAPVPASATGPAPASRWSCRQ